MKKLKKNSILFLFIFFILNFVGIRLDLFSFFHKTSKFFAHLNMEQFSKTHLTNVSEKKNLSNN